MVRPHGVDLLNLVRERRRLVDEQLQELVRRGLAREQLELLVYCPSPCVDDTGADLNSFVSSCGTQGSEIDVQQ